MSTDDKASKFPELVAYLDGELAQTEQAQVETRLANDPAYRQELAELQKTWDMLDVLPSVRATQSFTQSTVELVVVNAEKQIRDATGNMARITQVGTWVLIIAISALAFYYGYSFTSGQLDRDNRQTIDDLQIIQRFPLYRSINAELNPEKSIEFLERLSDEMDVFISFDEHLSETVKQQNFVESIAPQDLTHHEVEKRTLEQLSINKRGFEKLASQKENLREFHRLLNNHPEKDKLVDALSDYHVWLRHRILHSTQEEVDAIKDAAPEARVDLIKQLEKRYFTSIFRHQFKVNRIPAFTDYKKIKAFGLKLMNDLRDEIILHMATQSDVSQFRNELENAPTDHHRMAIMMREREKMIRDQDDLTLLSNPFDPGEIRDFIAELSPESKGKITDLKSEQHQIMIVQIWILMTIRVIDDEDLALFEDRGLNGAQRKSLDKLKTYNEKRKCLETAFRLSLQPFYRSDSAKLPDDLTVLKEEDLKRGFSPKSKDR